MKTSFIADRYLVDGHSQFNCTHCKLHAPLLILLLSNMPTIQYPSTSPRFPSFSNPCIFRQYMIPGTNTYQVRFTINRKNKNVSYGLEKTISQTIGARTSTNVTTTSHVMQTSRQDVSQSRCIWSVTQGVAGYVFPVVASCLGCGFATTSRNVPTWPRVYRRDVTNQEQYGEHVAVEPVVRPSYTLCTAFLSKVINDMGRPSQRYSAVARSEG